MHSDKLEVSEDDLSFNPYLSARLIRALRNDSDRSCIKVSRSYGFLKDDSPATNLAVDEEPDQLTWTEVCNDTQISQAINVQWRCKLKASN